MAVLEPNPPVFYQGGATALAVCGIEIPFEKSELKLHCKKTETTCTTSYSNGFLWSEYEPGVLGGSLSWETHWRIDQVITPPMILPGVILPIRVFARRPQTDDDFDQGAFFAFRIIVDDSTLSFEPKSGVVEWKISSTITGPISIFV